MVLVDTSVLIDFLKVRDNPKTAKFREILLRKTPFGISAYSYQELLQGSKDDSEWNRLVEYLSSQKIYFLKNEAETYERAARIFFDLRRKGVTPRSTLDILIVLTAIDNDLALLHNDRDFDLIAGYLPELKIFV